MKHFFELKKIFIISLLILLANCYSAFAIGNFQEGVELYRKNKPKECLEIMNSIVKKEPKNPYVIYYQALASTKLGKLEDAKNFYRQVIKINEDNKLIEFAKEGIENIEKAQGIKTQKQENKLEKTTKTAQKPSNKEQKDEKTEVSDEEVLKAIKTLREAGLLNVNLQAGILPATQSSESNTNSNPLGINNEMLQMNMLMSSLGGNGGKSNDMLPMLMMMQGQNGKNISPEILQMMMNNTMLDGLSTFDTKDK